jgi:hypothetical protein
MRLSRPSQHYRSLVCLEALTHRPGYLKTEINMFVVARPDHATLFGVGLGVVVPAWSAGTWVHRDVFGGVLAAWMPAIRAGMTDAVP